MRQDGHATRSKCGVETTIAVVGGKWKPMILYALLSGPRRFGELMRLIPGVTQRMLTLQLRELEADGVIAREVYKQVPPKVEYLLLLPQGRDLSDPLPEKARALNELVKHLRLNVRLVAQSVGTTARYRA